MILKVEMSSRYKNESEGFMGFYKPNSGVDGSFEMLPNDNHCPCCGVWWVVNIKSFRYIVSRAVQAIAFQAYDSEPYDGKPILIWECNNCGYKTEHKDVSQ